VVRLGTAAICGAIVLSCLSAAGCKKRRAASRSGHPVAERVPDRLVISYARVRRTRAEPPARFAAALPLPRQWARFGSDQRFPPREHVADLIAAGDPDMQARWMAALRAAVQQGATEKVLRKTWGELLRFHTAPGLCAFAARHAVGAEPAPIRAFFWELLPECEGPAVAGLFARPDAPGRALLAFANEQQLRERPGPAFSKAMAAAADEIIAGGDDELEARVTAFSLAQLGDPKAVEQLLRLHGSVKNSKRRHDIAMALSTVQKNPRAQAIAKAACAADRTDPVCSPSELPAPLPVAKSLDALATTEQVDVVATIDKREGPEVTAALEACAERNPTVHVRRTCLEKLEARDWARASRLAGRVDPGDDPDFRELRARLARYPSAAAFVVRVNAANLEAKLDGEGKAPGSVREILLQSNRMHSFDTETDQFPNEHDSLLRTLAAIAGPRFPKVVFEEIAPGSDRKVKIDSEEDPSEDEGPYTLVAYAGGQRLEATAQNLGDWYDVATVMGLLNVIARDAGIDVRFAALATTDQSSHVVALSESALRAFAKEGLLVFDASADQGRALGREYEEKALGHMGVR
jgi:hypothetical protein